MPIGSSKLGVLGAGLVPGGSVTFNTSGNWTVPPGVKKVSITGRGGTGNPGNAGNPGNPGNPGSGGAGGAGGRSIFGVGTCCRNLPIAFRGGMAARPDMITRGTFNVSPPTPVSSFYPNGTAPPNYINQVSIGGIEHPSLSPGSSGQSGQGGNAGSGGNAGNPGNGGQPSSGLGNTFPGGAGGNAGVAGAAGNAGSAGGGGSGGNAAQEQTPQGGNPGNGGSGGTGGGSGGNGNNFTNPNPLGGGRTGGRGGGGAGATNSGSNGQPGTTVPQLLYARGGNDAQVSATVNPTPGGLWFPSNTACPQSAIPTNIMGGSVESHGLTSITFANAADAMYQPSCTRQPGRVNLPQFSPTPLAPNVIRAGAGGGGAGTSAGNNNTIFWGGGGGGGGGRGNAGNAGGSSPTPSGTAGTPQTFNCVTVTPGATTPIVVGSPGGTVTISWNPQ